MVSHLPNLSAQVEPEQIPWCSDVYMTNAGLIGRTSLPVEEAQDYLLLLPDLTDWQFDNVGSHCAICGSHNPLYGMNILLPGCDFHMLRRRSPGRPYGAVGLFKDARAINRSPLRGLHHTEITPLLPSIFGEILGIDENSCSSSCPEGQTCCSGRCCPPYLEDGCCNYWEDQACCNGRCITLGTPDNCTICGHRCEAPFRCCRDFKSGQFICADVQEEDQNCGECGNVCSPGMTCCGGRCIPACDASRCQRCNPATQRCEPCSSDQICCGGRCIPACNPARCEGCVPDRGRCVDQCAVIGLPCVDGECCFTVIAGHAACCVQGAHGNGSPEYCAAYGLPAFCCR